MSIVVYREVTCEDPQFWLTFGAEPGQQLFLQLLTPEIDGLRAYRPSLALIGPGLPAADLPFDVPDGLGAYVFETANLTDPPVFDEPITQTRSWILVEETVPAVDAGRHFVVAFDPAGASGKLSVAIGTIEAFGLADLGMLPAWTEQTRTFHETPDYAPDVPATVGMCETDGVPLPVGGGDTPGDDEPQGATSSVAMDGVAGGGAPMPSMPVTGTDRAGGCRAARVATPPWSTTVVLALTWLGFRARRRRSLR